MFLALLSMAGSLLMVEVPLRLSLLAQLMKMIRKAFQILQAEIEAARHTQGRQDSPSFDRTTPYWSPRQWALQELQTEDSFYPWERA